MSTQPAPKDALFVVSASPDGTRLLADIQPLNGKAPPSLAVIKQEISKQGFGSALIDDAALADMQKRWAGEQRPAQMPIGALRNAKISIAISKNKLEAYLTIEKACGGKAATVDDVMTQIKKEGIKHGIDSAAISKAVAAGEAKDLLIAKGRAAKDGERAKFVQVVAAASDRRPNLQSDGSVDYRDVINVVTVKAGEALMRRDPATKGIAGIDVKGRELPAKDGKDVPFSTRVKNAKTPEGNPNMLVAAISGQPVLEADGMSVDPTLTVAKVDISTGNLEFDGTVVIAGDVLTGMKVRVMGDVYVGGMVEASSIEAGGSIVVKGGVIGRGEVRQANGKQSESVAHLKAGMAVQARFIENSVVTAKSDVVVKDLVAHSEIKTDGRVVVGAKGSAKGQIIGGVIEAAAGVEALNIGTAGGAVTKLKVGGPVAQLKEKLRQLEAKVEALQLKKRQLTMAIQQLMMKQPVDDAIIKKAHATDQTLDAEAVTLHHQLNEANNAIKRLTNAKVAAKQRMYGGVEMTFLDKSRAIKEEMGPVQFLLENGSIIQK